MHVNWPHMLCSIGTGRSTSLVSRTERIGNFDWTTGMAGLYIIQTRGDDIGDAYAGEEGMVNEDEESFVYV